MPATWKLTQCLRNLHFLSGPKKIDYIHWANEIFLVLLEAVYPGSEKFATYCSVIFYNYPGNAVFQVYHGRKIIQELYYFVFFCTTYLLKLINNSFDIHKINKYSVK